MTKRLTILMGILKALLTAAPLLSAELPESVCYVRAALGDKVNDRGTGVLISNNPQRVGYVLTACHVVEENPQSLTVSFPSVSQTLEARLVAFKSDRDIALLSVRGAKAAHRGISFEPVSLRDQVFQMGFGNDKEPPGVVRGRIRSRASHLIISTSIARSGDSGGPLCNMSGEVVGIISACRENHLSDAGTYCGPIAGWKRLRQLCHENERSIVRMQR